MEQAEELQRIKEQTLAAANVSAQRFMEMLPWESERELVILKGHLLIEELLRAFLIKYGAERDALNNARLSFSQCVGLCKAFSRQELFDWHWNALRLLNSIRNDLAHQLEPAKIDSKIQQFIESIEEDQIPPPPVLKSKIGELPLAMFRLYISLAVGLHMDQQRILALLSVGR